MVYGGTHSNYEKAIFEELCQIVEEAIWLYRKEGKPLPPATSCRDFANKMQQVAWLTKCPCICIYLHPSDPARLKSSYTALLFLLLWNVVKSLLFLRHSASNNPLAGPLEQTHYSILQAPMIGGAND